MSAIVITPEQRLILATLIDTFVAPMSRENTERIVREYCRDPAHAQVS